MAARHLPWLVPAALLLLLATGRLDETGRTPAPPSTLALGAALGAGDPAGYRRAVEPRELRFPRDHGAHPGFRTEWWYFTGNLYTTQGRRFGYQWVVFRVALRPEAQARPSRWATDEIYTGHLAITDPEARRFRFFERYARAALGLSGARGEPFRVWLEDWSVAEAADDPATWRLQAADEGAALELELVPAKPLVLQGDRGLSQKGAAPGNASHYYSFSRLNTRGTLVLDGERHAVTGLSWMDREWGTSALDAGQDGWDWFALQLRDGRELMFYRLRRADGSADPHSAGVVIDAAGRPAHLGAGDVEVRVLETWVSPRGVAYPARWRLIVPAHGLDLEILPVLADQELDTAVRYWEGAVDAHAAAGAREPVGAGYVELTGYN